MFSHFLKKDCFSMGLLFESTGTESMGTVNPKEFGLTRMPELLAPGGATAVHSKEHPSPKLSCIAVW